MTMEKLRNIGINLFFALATLGMIDMMVHAWTDGKVRLIHQFLTIFFPR